MENKAFKTMRRPGQSIEGAVAELLDKMTVEEKLGQMSQSVGADIIAIGSTKVNEPVAELIKQGKIGSMIQVGEPAELAKRIRGLQRIAVEESRLGIPLLFCQDVIHGFETVFPIPLAWSCSFDEQLIKCAARASAQEATCCGIMYAYAPMVDVPHDPRWGRVAETAGEDPWWSAQVSKALVQGLSNAEQGHGLLACLKHFIGYAAAEAGRDYNTTEFSETALRNLYLPPFKEGIKAGAGSVMTAFNVINGVPAAANKELLKGLLREELGFEGIIISDYSAVMELMCHGVARDEKDAACLAVNAGMDIEMTTRYFGVYGKQLLQEGKISIQDIDAAVRRILTAKYKLGIMDNPYLFLRENEIEATVFNEATLNLSKELAVRSAVLLKNDGALPLKSGQKVALIGPFVNSTDLCGCWSFSTRRGETVTIEQGLRSKGVNLVVEKGCEVLQSIENGIQKALAAAQQADIVVLALGESSVMSGEACSRMDITLPECQQELARQLLKVNKPIALVLTNGRPLLLEWFDKSMNAILEAWAPGSQAGHAIAQLLTGEEVPGGKLTMSFPRSIGQIPLYYNELPTGRPYTQGSTEHFLSKYIDGPNTPLYPFGHGLGYSGCECSEAVLSDTVLKRGDKLTVTVTLENKGQYTARETVQLYLRDCVASISRPVMELKAVKKAVLEPMQAASVAFEITEPMLRFYNAHGQLVSENGQFEVMVGLSSEKAALSKQLFELV